MRHDTRQLYRKRARHGAQPYQLAWFCSAAVADFCAAVDKGHTFGLAEALLPLLEPLTAKRWSCPYYQVKFDMSWVVWVLTSNECRLLPEPLLSRCPPIRMRHLTPAELLGFVRREGAKRTLSETAIEAICEVLAHPVVESRHPSLRVAIRMLQRAANLDTGPMQH